MFGGLRIRARRSILTTGTARRSGAHQAAARPATGGTVRSLGETPATWGPSAMGPSSQVGGPRAPADASRARVRCCPGAPGSPRAAASPRRSAARASSLRGPRPRYLLAKPRRATVGALLSAERTLAATTSSRSATREECSPNLSWPSQILLGVIGTNVCEP